MDLQKLLLIIDKHVNQEALAKELLREFVLPIVEKELSELKIDIIPGTTLDEALMKSAIDATLAALRAKAAA